MGNMKLPDGWKLDILDNVTSIIRNGANIKQGEVDGGYPITRIETISNAFIDINKLGYAGIEELGKYKDYLLEQGDILMSHINSEKHLGKVAIYENCNMKIIHGMNLLGIRFNNKTILPKYAYYFLNTKKFKSQLPRITKKSVNQASFSIRDLKNLKIIVPPLETQKKIVEVLEKAEKAIEKRKEIINLLDELVKSRFIEMFGNIITNSYNWDTVKLKDISMLKSGGTPTRSKPEYFDGDIPWITTVALGKNLINENDAIEYITQEAIDNSATKLIQAGSLLFGMRVGVGKTSVNTVSMCTNQDIMAITDIDTSKYNLIFLKKIIENYSEYFNNQKRGATIQGIKSDTLKEVSIPTVKVDLQNKFVDFVKQVDKLKFEMEKSLKELENNFNSLMQRAFKGELKIK